MKTLGSQLVHGLKKSLGILGIVLLSAVLLTLGALWLLEYRAQRSIAQFFAALPEPLQDGDFRAIQVVPPLPALTKFPRKPVREADSELNPSELVLGVEVGGEARAYPINMLTGPDREILNDTLGGRPIAATW